MGRVRVSRVRGAELVVVLAVGVFLAGCSSDGNAAPSGVPSAVSTVEGEVSSVATPSAKNWAYSVTVADAKAQQASVDMLVKEGFTLNGSSDNELGSNHSLTKDELDVTLSLQTSGDRFLVVYNVLQR